MILVETELEEKMKKVIAEIVKDIRELEEKKQEVLHSEDREKTITYPKDEKPVDAGYSFAKTREEIARLDEQIRHLKGVLTKANVETIVENQKMSLGSCLIYLAQLNNEKNLLAYMGNAKEFYQTVGPGGVIQYTQTQYTIAELKEYLENINQKIKRLQLDIDRTNLTTEVEV